MDSTQVSPSRPTFSYHVLPPLDPRPSFRTAMHLWHSQPTGCQFDLKALLKLK